MVGWVVGREVPGQYAQQVVSTLQVIKVRDVLQKAVMLRWLGILTLASQPIYACSNPVGVHPALHEILRCALAIRA